MVWPTRWDVCTRMLSLQVHHLFRLTLRWWASWEWVTTRWLVQPLQWLWLSKRRWRSKYIVTDRKTPVIFMIMGVFYLYELLWMIPSQLMKIPLIKLFFFIKCWDYYSKFPLILSVGKEGGWRCSALKNGWNWRMFCSQITAIFHFLKMAAKDWFNNLIYSNI